jgi:hypothetical protein
MTRRRSVWPMIFAGGLLGGLLLAGYGFAYWRLMRPCQWLSIKPLGGVVSPPCRGVEYPFPWLERFFSPAHWLDTQIRRQYWECPP